MSLEANEVLLKNLLRLNMLIVKNQLQILMILGKKWKKSGDKKSPIGSRVPEQ